MRATRQYRSYLPTQTPLKNYNNPAMRSPMAKSPPEPLPSHSTIGGPSQSHNNLQASINHSINAYESIPTENTEYITSLGSIMLETQFFAPQTNDKTNFFFLFGMNAELSDIQ
eukprot:3333063-Ditylum_brightwellii.AAC.2